MSQALTSLDPVVPVDPASFASLNLESLDPISYAGVLDAIRPLDQFHEEAVRDDLDGEGETIPTLEEGDDPGMIADLLNVVNEVSKGVSERTHNEYKRCVLLSQVCCRHLQLTSLLRLMKQCEEFLVWKKLVAPEQKFFSNKPHKHAPEFIASWIMNESVHSSFSS
jgi:hypothetical protein